MTASCDIITTAEQEETTSGPDTQGDFPEHIWLANSARGVDSALLL